MVSKDTKKVLIIEDEESIRSLLKYFLTSEGYTVEEAGNGKEGLDKALNADYSLIILDIMMPELSGWDFLKRYRQYRDTPVIVLSARDLDEDFRLGASLNVADYFTKPFDPEELVNRVKELIGA